MPSAMDNTFGPVLPDHFDFTLLFERSMLGMVPAGIAILIVPVYLRAMARAANQVRPGRLLWAKLATAAALVGIQLASIILWHNAGLLRSDVALAASITSLVASLGIAIILYIAHTFFLCPSAFLSVYFSLTMVFDVTMARSYFLRHSIDALGGLQVTVAGLKLVLVLLEEVPKRQLFRSNLLRPGLGETVGFWNRTLLLWVNPLLRLGFRKNIHVEDLPEIGDRYDSQRLFDSDASEGVTDGLIGAAIFIFGGLMLSRSVFERLEFQAITSVRGMLVMALYAKVQRLSVGVLEKSAAITLLTTDIAGLQDGLGYLHSSWSSLLELGLGVYVLYTFVGYACFLLFIPSSISALGTYIVTKNMASARTIWNEKVETRVAATSNILAQLKSIKAMGLTQVMSTYLQEKRVHELDTSMKERNFRIMNYGVYGFGAAMTPVAVLAGARFWTRVSNPMTVSEIFAAYAAIFVAVSPLNNLLVSLPFFADGYSCLIRVQNFLMLPEMRDQRQCQEPGEVTVEKSEKTSAASQSSGCAVEMRNVSVVSEASGHILQDVTLRIPMRSLAMMHGSIGSGKSSFLKALLGELGIDSGTIEIASKRVAYASQSPWIQNTTIKDNVVGLCPFDELLYNEVVFACALDKDLDELSDGDQTMAGSNGCNLSGGQKQRLGLARSLFACTSIILLDDVLSALDTNTASLVFQRVCGPNGLLRRRNCTTIMTTNKRVISAEILGEADLVFEISEQGRVRLDKAYPRRDRIYPPLAGASREASQTEVPRIETQQDSVPVPFKRSKTEPETDELDRHRRHGDVKLYGYFFTTANVWLFVLWISATAIASIMERMPQIFLRIWMTADAGNDWYFAGFAAISFVEVIVTCAGGALFLKQVLPLSSAELHWRLLQTVMGSTLSFISHTDAGSLLNRFSQDISLITQRMPLMLMTAASMFFNVLVDIGIISSGSKYTPPIMVFLVGVLYAIQHYYLRTSRQLRYLDLETTAPMITHLTETTSGIAHIRGLGWQEHFDAELALRLNHAQRPFYFLFCVQQWLTLALDFTTFVSAVTLVSIATIFPGSTSESAIGLALLNLISFSTTASWFLRTWVSLETSLGGLARIKAFCKDTPVEEDPADAEPLPENWPTSGKIDYKGVTASYTGPNGEVRPALNDTSFSIPHGQKVGISGRTGSGKSSMLLSLLHLMDYHGEISIDGCEIKTIPRHLLRSRVTSMTQDSVELKGTIRLNVYPFDTTTAAAATAPSDDDMVAALDRVGLWAHLQRHGGLDGDVADAGLSHGQKQLLCLARALLHQSSLGTRVVLVDEATSALDPRTDARAQALMAEAWADCTVLTIAHQREGLDFVDRVMELESGHLMELRPASPTDAWGGNF
ncbi:Vacuolar metal resistance and drug detoxification protein [Akanthomyces lecanii RCEF 1005]|uniref:Vacuolar metal resistance and drug detoxification protein n=1 Tax=Akanthomyces lecanii RCEF 1005 TaxID=1081108 RepID=A0A168BFA1_CORDF|nr:Vacuolar metal resistance and drug detoxification protein [Akanthomyces lecanii RCEF 1005]